MKMSFSTAPSSAPESLQASADDPTSISLSWSAPPLEGQNGIIRHYEVTLVVLETGEIHIRTSVSLTLTITSLRPFTTYNCTVAAETVAIGPSTTGVIVRTLQTGIIHSSFKTAFILLFLSYKYIAPSAPPENVQASAEDSRTLRLSWEPPTDGSRNGIILRYFYNITELESQSSFVYSTTGESVVVDDLHPYYRYSCIVAAETVELGPYSAPVTIQLPEDGMNIKYYSAFHTFYAIGLQLPLVLQLHSLYHLLLQLVFSSRGLIHCLFIRMASFVSISSISLSWTQAISIRTLLSQQKIT